MMKITFPGSTSVQEYLLHISKDKTETEASFE